MTYLFKLARRTARQRALSLIALAAALTGCDTDRLTDPTTEAEPVSVSAPSSPTAVGFTPAFASSFAGGIPFGTFNHPTSALSSVYNGALRVILPNELLGELAAIKARGGRVVLSLVGPKANFVEKDGDFSLTLWKERVDRYRGVNFNSYIQDGTIIGHYLMDEPNDAHNWNGRPVPGSMVEQMAAYSKQLWPGMATIVRVDPGYLTPWAPYRHLDAAWAQYVTRKGTAEDYIKRNIADAQRLGLMLVTGLNISKGDGGREMSADLVESAGTTLLEQSYPCAFLSWTYDDEYLARANIRTAMSRLSQMARNHVSRSCGGSQSSPPPPPPTLPGIKGIILKAETVRLDGRQVIKLTWSGATGSRVDIRRNGSLSRTTPNDGKAYTAPRPGTYAFQICEAGKTRCSNRSSGTIR
jgi:hypothetical protein